MKMKNWLLLVFCMAASAMFAQTDIVFGPVEDNGSTRSADFKFVRDGQKEIVEGLEAGDLTCIELVGDNQNPLQIKDLTDISVHNDFSKDIDVLIIVDKSENMGADVYLAMREAIVNFAEALPKSARIYISALGNEVTATERVTPGESIRTYIRSDEMCEQADDQINIYSALIAKIQEFKNMPESDSFIPEMAHNAELAADTQTDKYVYFFTGNIDQYTDPAFMDAKFKFVDDEYLPVPEQLKAIYCVYFGSEFGEYENEMNFICHRSANGRVFQEFSTDSLTAMFASTIDPEAMDYRITWAPQDGAAFNSRATGFQLKAEKVQAAGSIQMAVAAVDSPLLADTEAGNDWLKNSLLWCVILLVAAWLILQLLVPFINYQIFRSRYVKKFHIADAHKNLVLQQCYYCKGEFEEGDLIVTKCKHTVHAECWDENNGRCPEYGISDCKDGIYTYNRKNLLDRKNAPDCIYWVLAGLAGGLASWLLLQYVQGCGMFEGLIGKLVSVFYGDQASSALPAFIGKIQPGIWCGILFGFVITLLFSLMSAFQKGSAVSYVFALVRAICGAVAGAVAFIIWGAACVALQQSGNCLWLDWLPWILTGLGVAACLAVKSEVSVKNALMAGLLGAIVAYLLISSLPVEIIGAIGCMLFGAVIGGAVAIVQYPSESYFLHVEGSTKQRDIAIYKWMNSAGGSRHVTIGRSDECVIQMTWDKSEQIADKQLELYLEKDLPYALALADGTVLDENAQPLPVGKTIRLKHGCAFTIGETLFTYIEKDK